MLSLIQRLFKLSAPGNFAGVLFGGELLAGAMRGAPQCDWLSQVTPQPLQKLNDAT